MGIRVFIVRSRGTVFRLFADTIAKNVYPRTFRLRDKTMYCNFSSTDLLGSYYYFVRLRERTAGGKAQTNRDVQQQVAARGKREKTWCKNAVRKSAGNRSRTDTSHRRGIPELEVPSAATRGWLCTRREIQTETTDSTCIRLDFVFSATRVCMNNTTSREQKVPKRRTS